MKKIFLLIAVLLFAQYTFLFSQNIVSFKINSNWTFKSTDDSVWLPAIDPGSVHTDLLANKLIGNPYYRLNERKQQWIDKKNWEYKTSFSINEQTLNHDVVDIFFKGLDTYAKVYLNDTLILDADNMFIQWNVDCKDKLLAGRNTLKIVFESPIIAGLTKRDTLGYLLPGAENDQSELGGIGNKKTCVFTRKAQYQFGWDWGPRLVSSGIWQDVEFMAWNKCNITDVNIIQKKLSKNIANLIADIEIKSIDNEIVTIKGSIDSAQLFITKVTLKKGLNKISIPFNIPNPEMWWTNGMGNHKLYNIKIQIGDSLHILSVGSRSIGLRTLKVVQKDDSIGSSFYFELNGYPVFMKGANYIPQDVFPGRVSDKDYERLIKSAADAHINMLRVWGGGFYEKDIFYNLCDKYGILVWQDFMFACAMYPGNKEFLANVKQEATQNIVRLRNHPCIALWCGNNEILSAWNRWGWKEDVLSNQGKDIADTIWKAYDNLFNKMLPNVVNNLDSTRFYWSSSPGAGGGKLEDGNSGDNHYWGVWWAKQPFTKYKEEIPRFMSEYGFQSFPDLNSVKKYALEQDWDINSEVMRSHQRSSIGNSTIVEYMTRDYILPHNFPMFLYVNQVLQAEGIKTAIEAHRSNMPRCMGSLYWQLNDCWPVASWSGIDSYGNWKAMHYFVKKAFNNILVIPDADSLNTLTVTVVSDSLKNVDASLKFTIINFDGDTITSGKKNITILPNKAHIYFEENLDSLLAKYDRRQILFYVEIIDSNNCILSNNILYFKKIKDLILPIPNIVFSVDDTTDGFVIKISTDKLAKNLYLRADDIDGNYSDNYFDLLPGQSANVRFFTDDTIAKNEFISKLNIFTIKDSY